MSKGSSNVSLGPYRSTELALEERLTKKESNDLSNYIRRKNFGIFDNNHKLGIKDLAGMLPALGYGKESGCLYIKHEIQSGADKFVYLSEEEHTLISGNYNVDNNRILKDMEIINDMRYYSIDSIFFMLGGKCSAIDAFIGISFGAIFTSITYGLAYLAFGARTAFGVSFLTGFFGLVGGLFCPIIVRESRYNSRMAEMASYLSINANNYSFGGAVYQQIVEEYCKLKILGNNPELLESSEIKQLPETKENLK